METAGRLTPRSRPSYFAGRNSRSTIIQRPDMCSFPILNTQTASPFSSWVLHGASPIGMNMSGATRTPIERGICRHFSPNTTASERLSICTAGRMPGRQDILVRRLGAAVHDGRARMPNLPREPSPQAVDHNLAKASTAPWRTPHGLSVPRPTSYRQSTVRT